jgi:hypothetical protein
MKIILKVLCPCIIWAGAAVGVAFGQIDRAGANFGFRSDSDFKMMLPYEGRFLDANLNEDLSGDLDKVEGQYN